MAVLGLREATQDRTMEQPRALSRRLYVPSFLLAAVTAWFVWEGAVPLIRDGALNSTFAAARYQLVGPAVIVFVVAVIVCERIWPAERRKTFARGHLLDACYLIFFAAAIVPFTSLLGVASAVLLHDHAAWMDGSWTASWPRWLLGGVALVAMDAANWLTHLADHKLEPLWRVHAVHHSQEELSVLTTFRAHPLVHTVSFAVATLPVFALTGDRPMAPVLITVYLCLGAFPHANVRWALGPLGKIFCSPAYHRIHHKIDGPNDVNLGIVLTVWDVLARRAVFPQRGAEPCRTGLAGRPIIVEQGGNRLQPVRVIAEQLLEPFARSTH
jgi:sterol desaturase/sphingolipid hydroxylase (fatty acid hydroxylase superfamily)